LYTHIHILIERQYQLISQQFNLKSPKVKTPAPPKVKSGGSKPNLLKPIPTPEERSLMAAKARKLDAETRQIERGY
jgi:hypothetical protein